MKIVSIIPARLGSSRFPNKPMALVDGIPMIEYVYKKVKKSNLISQVYIATPDKEIYEHIVSKKGLAVMTSSSHERASDRCCEALKIIEKETATIFDIILMVQGDEPLINEAMISESIQPLLINKDVYISNLLGKINSVEEFKDKNSIKVVCDINSYAMYFSRQPIPYEKSNSLNNNIGKQVCVIPFKRDFLIEYSLMKETPLERLESIDMLRILENGKKVFMAKTNFQNQSVDTSEDLDKVNLIIKNSRSD